MAEQFSVSFLLKLIDNISSPLAKVGGAFDDIDKKFSAAGKSAMSMGKSMTAFATLPIMGWATYASHEAGKVNEAFREMGNALENLPADKLGALKTDIETMSTQIPRSVEELAEYAKMAGKMNELGDVPGFTKFMAKFTIANEDMRGNTATFMDMARAIGLTQAEYEHTGDVITGLAKRFNTSASDIVKNALDIGGSFEAPKDQLMVLAAYMDTFGASAQPIRRLLDEMNLAAMEMDTLNLEIMTKAAGFGTNTAGFSKEFKESPATALQKLLKGFGDLKGDDAHTLRKMFEKIGLDGQKVIGVVNKTITSLPELGRALAFVADKQKVSGAMAREAAEKTGNFGNQMSILMNTLDLFATQFGKDIKPVFTWFVDAAKSLLNIFTNLPAPIRFATEVILGITAAIGPLLIGVSFLEKGLAASGVAAKILGISLKGALGWIGLIITALMLLAEYWEPIKKSFDDSAKSGVINSIGNSINKAGAWRDELYSDKSGVMSSGAGGVMVSKGEAVIRVELGSGLKSGEVKSKGNIFTEVITPGYLGMKICH